MHRVQRGPKFRTKLRPRGGHGFATYDISIATGQFQGGEGIPSLGQQVIETPLAFTSRQNLDYGAEFIAT